MSGCPSRALLAPAQKMLAGLVLVVACCTAGTPARADATPVYRAVVRDALVSIAPPALLREGHLYLPLAFLESALGVSSCGGSEEWTLSFFERSAEFCLGAEVAGEAPRAAAVEGEVYFRADLLGGLLGGTPRLIRRGEGPEMVEVPATGARVQSTRLGEHADKVRLVVDLDGETVFSWRRSALGVELMIPSPVESAAGGNHLGLQQFSNPRIRQVMSSRTAEGFTQLDIVLAEGAEAEVFTLANPARIVLDVPLPPEAPQETGPAPRPVPPAAGPGRPPRWTVRDFSTSRGPLKVYVLQVSPQNPHWRLLPALAGDTVHTRSSVAAISRRHGAVAGINGGFFSTQGPPLGLLVRDGEWITTPLFRRTMLALSESGEARMGRWAFDGRLVIARRGYLSLTAINRAHVGGDELILYTRRWGRELPGNALYTRMVVSPEDQVVLKETQGRTVQIPERGWLLSARGRQAELLKKIEVGETARLELGLNPPWPDLWCAIEGGPRLLVDGQVFIYGREEQFRNDVCVGAASRSALGITQEGDVLLVAVESPGTGRGGVTLEELAGIMRKLGAWQAMNLDGGGSTTVVQDAEIINRVRGNARAVSNALLVVARPPTVAQAPAPAPAPAAPPLPEPPPGAVSPPIVGPGPGLEPAGGPGLEPGGT